MGKVTDAVRFVKGSDPSLVSVDAGRVDLLLEMKETSGPLALVMLEADLDDFKSLKECEDCKDQKRIGKRNTTTILWRHLGAMPDVTPMDKLTVTESLIRSTIAEMAPLVEGLTGWRLDPESLSVRVLPKTRGYEEIVLARLRGTGIPVDETAPRNVIERIVEYVIENSVLAAYDPTDQEVLVVGENVDESNMDGLRLVAAHELVHRGQHVHHPELFGRIDDALRDVFRVLSSERATFRDIVARLEGVQGVMSLLESHAYYVQQTLHDSRYPAAHIESHFNLPSILMRVFGRRKRIQYTRELPAVAKATETGTLESLYRDVRLRR